MASETHYVVYVSIKRVVNEVNPSLARPKKERSVEDILSVTQLSDSITEAVNDIANHMNVVRNRSRVKAVMEKNDGEV
jgi:hypothetical protein